MRIRKPIHLSDDRKTFYSDLGTFEFPAEILDANAGDFSVKFECADGRRYTGFYDYRDEGFLERSRLREFREDLTEFMKTNRKSAFSELLDEMQLKEKMEWKGHHWWFTKQEK
jgi:hypothetical protein